MMDFIKIVTKVVNFVMDQEQKQTIIAKNVKPTTFFLMILSMKIIVIRNVQVIIIMIIIICIIVLFIVLVNIAN